MKPRVNTVTIQAQVDDARLEYFSKKFCGAALRAANGAERRSTKKIFVPISWMNYHESVKASDFYATGKQNDSGSERVVRGFPR